MAIVILAQLMSQKAVPLEPFLSYVCFSNKIEQDIQYIVTSWRKLDV